MLRAEAPVIFGDGEQTRDFTYVGDVVDAVTKAATAPDPDGAPINIGGGERVSINALARIIASATGCTVSPVHEPVRPGDVRDSLADIGRATDWLGWSPQTSLEEGIAEVIAALPGSQTTSQALEPQA
jgi:hypothetical protein